MLGATPNLYATIVMMVAEKVVVKRRLLLEPFYAARLRLSPRSVLEHFVPISRQRLPFKNGSLH